MNTLLEAASGVLSAVMSQVKSYATDTGLFAREYTIPSSAFLLACLGLVMALLGPEVPGLWWESLGLDLKALTLGLLALLVLVFVQLSTVLIVPVRRIYSGDSQLSWFRTAKRQMFLRDQHARRELDDRFQRLFQGLVQVRRELHRLANVPASAPELGPGAQWYLVPVQPLRAYQVLSAVDLEEKLLGPYAEPMVTHINHVDGQYTRDSLDTGVPIPRRSLVRVPGHGYFDSNRELMMIDLGSKLPAYLDPGTVVTLLLIPKQPTPSPKPFEVDDVLLVDAPSDQQVVLSVPREAVSDIASRRDYSAVDLVSSAASDQPRLVVARDIQPGELITARDLANRHLAGPAPARPISIREVGDKLYWPPQLETDHPESAPPLLAGSPLDAPDVFRVASESAVAYLNGSSTAHRPRAYALRLDSHHTLGPGVTLPGMAVVYVRETDPRRSWAVPTYVYQVSADWCYVAVADPVAFGVSIQTAESVSVGRSCWGPTLRPGATYGVGQLIDPSSFAVAAFDAAEVPGMIWACERNAVPATLYRDYYVPSGSAPPHASAPILQTALACATENMVAPLSIRFDSRPANWKLDQVRDTNGRRQRLAKGDIAQLRLVGAAGELQVARVFVQSVEYAVARRLRSVELAILDNPLDPLVGTHTVSFEITNSDAVLRHCARTINKTLASLDDAHHQSVVLNGGDGSVRRLSALAEKATIATAALAQGRTSLALRSWLSPGAHTQNETSLLDIRPLAIQLYEAVARLTDATQAVRELHRAGGALAFPEIIRTRPSTLGNLLAAAAEYPRNAYGINTESVLPRLLNGLSADDPTLKRVAQSESMLNMLVLFSFWAGVWFLMALVATVGAWAMHASSLPIFPFLLAASWFVWWFSREGAQAQALSHGEALKTLFDARRRVVFAAHGMLLDASAKPPPDALTPSDERGFWRLLNRLYAFADTSGFPPLVTPPGSATPAAGSAASTANKSTSSSPTNGSSPAAG